MEHTRGCRFEIAWLFVCVALAFEGRSIVFNRNDPMEDMFAEDKPPVALVFFNGKMSEYWEHPSTTIDRQTNIAHKAAYAQFRNQPQTLVSALNASASSAGAQSDKKTPAPVKTQRDLLSFFSSTSPPSAKKRQESPKTKQRDKADALVTRRQCSCPQLAVVTESCREKMLQ